MIARCLYYCDFYTRLQEDSLGKNQEMKILVEGVSKVSNSLCLVLVDEVLLLLVGMHVI